MNEKTKKVHGFDIIHEDDEHRLSIHLIDDLDAKGAMIERHVTFQAVGFKIEEVTPETYLVVREN